MSATNLKDFEAQLIDNLPLIDRLTASLARRHGLASDAGADFGSFVKLKLIEGEYAILRKFRGESSLSTYLTVVLAMLFREYRVRQWGRWRPSAAAVRRGPLAVRLETLVHRDGCAFDEAAQILRSSGQWGGTDRELGTLLAALPRRTAIRPEEVPLDGVELAESASRSDDLAEAGEADAESVAAEMALKKVLASLSAEDAVIIRMHFCEDASIADIARALALPQKPLYRRIDRLVARIRRSLETNGFSSARARAILARTHEAR